MFLPSHESLAIYLLPMINTSLAVGAQLGADNRHQAKGWQTFTQNQRLHQRAGNRHPQQLKKVIQDRQGHSITTRGSL